MIILKLLTYSLVEKPIKSERGILVNTSRQQLHYIINMVDSKELDVLYRVLVKFIPEDEPLPDEIKAIRIGREEILRGEIVSHDDIDWS